MSSEHKDGGYYGGPQEGYTYMWRKDVAGTFYALRENRRKFTLVPKC